MVGSPDSLRYHWDAPPSDADTWVPFANPLTIDGPPGISPDACSNHVLHTQVRRGTIVDETPDHVFLRLDTMAAYVVPKRAFATTDALNAFVDTARRFARSAATAR